MRGLARGGDHRVRQHRKRRRGPQGRRFRLPDQTPVPRSAAHAGQVRAVPAPENSASQIWGRPASWLEPRDRAGALEDREARTQPGANLRYRRVGKRKRARRSSHSRQGVAAREGLRAGQLRRLSGPDGKLPMRLSEGAKKALASYDFPGNTRELENILERAIALAAREEIQPEDLQLAPPTWVAREPGAPNAKWPLPEYLDRLEKEAILEALEKTRFNRTAAAKLLGITFRALRYRMERLGIR